MCRDPAYYCGPGPAVVCNGDTGRLTVAFRRVLSLGSGFGVIQRVAPQRFLGYLEYGDLLRIYDEEMARAERLE